MTSPATFDDLVRELQREPAVAAQEADLQPSRDVALLLVSLRQRMHLSQSEFARKAGVSQAYVSQLESGTANPSVRRLNRLLRAVGATLRLSALIEIDTTDAECSEVSRRLER